mmetsp:Transcript_38088/g.86587  ORF Transcript_38088/g.86587 Transcript_38088/m.86587 type:complete len:238 (-) Transcript_38088:92-805(-)
MRGVAPWPLGVILACVLAVAMLPRADAERRMMTETNGTQESAVASARTGGARESASTSAATNAVSANASSRAESLAAIANSGNASRHSSTRSRPSSWGLPPRRKPGRAGLNAVMAMVHKPGHGQLPAGVTPKCKILLGKWVEEKQIVTLPGSKDGDPSGSSQRYKCISPCSVGCKNLLSHRYFVELEQINTEGGKQFHTEKRGDIHYQDCNVPWRYRSICSILVYDEEELNSHLAKL